MRPSTTLSPCLGSGRAQHPRSTAPPGRPRPRLRLPSAPTGGPAVEPAGRGEELVPELIAGTDTLERLLDRRVDPRTAFVDPVDAPAIDRLRESFVDRVAVRDESLVPAERHLTPARPFT